MLDYICENDNIKGFRGPGKRTSAGAPKINPHTVSKFNDGASVAPNVMPVILQIVIRRAIEA